MSYCSAQAEFLTQEEQLVAARKPTAYMIAF
jgi:hypothetical protein